MLYIGILASIILFALVFIPKIRDSFISKKLRYQLLWLLLILGTSYLILSLIKDYYNITFDNTRSFPFHFFNSSIASERNLAGRDSSYIHLYFGAAVAIFGTVLTGGLLISIFTNILEQRVNNIRQGLVAYRFNNHYLFIGYDDMAIGLIKQLESKKRKYLWHKRFFFNEGYYLIQTNQNTELVRHQIMSQLPSDITKNIYILYRHIESSKDLQDLYIQGARKIFLLGEKDTTEHDSNNIAMLQLLAQYSEQYKNGIFKPKKKIVDCHVLFDYQSTASIFQNKDLPLHLRRNINITSFNFHELWAQKVFINEGPNALDTTSSNLINYPNLDFDNITENSNKQVHLVIVGMTSMGIALAIKAMRIAHYANYKKRKTRITFIDSSIEQQRDIFISRYTSLYKSVDVYSGYEDELRKGNMSEYTDIELHFIDDRIERATCRDYILALSQDKDKLLTIAICHDDPIVSMAIGLYLPDKVYFSDSKILIRQETFESTLNCMERKEGDKYKYVYPFGMKNDCYNIKINDNYCPQLVNYIYCNPDNYAYNKPNARDLDTTWAALLMIHKWSNKYNIEHLPTKIRIIKDKNAKIENVQITDEDVDDKLELLANIEHNRWLMEKLLAGYQLCTDTALSQKKAELIRIQSLPVIKETDLKKQSELKKEIKILKKKNEELFLHDCLVSFDKLNSMDKQSDRVIIQSIPWLLERSNELENNLKK